MLRAVWLSAVHEARLLVKDPVVLLMLLLAPVVIITVAGYSLGALYGGGAGTRRLPVVDRDGGEVATRLVAALREEPSVEVETLADVAVARAQVSRTDGPPLAIEIPPGTTDAVRDGQRARLVLYVDPAKRIEANAVEIRLAELCRRAGEEAQATAQRRLDDAEGELTREIDRVGDALDAERTRLRDALDQTRAQVAERVRRELADAVARTRREVEKIVRAREADAWSGLQTQLEHRRAIVERLRGRLLELQASERAFADWLGRLRTLAGRHADDLPPPPPFPELPSDADLAALAAPIEPPPPAPVPDVAPAMRDPSTIGTIDVPAPHADVADLRAPEIGRLPGSLGLQEESATPGADVTVNAFDQYVPGFGITFLMIGMMLGVALTLFDERDWGTLQRLAAGGVSMPGVLLGKLATRFVVGVIQMVVLFAVGRVLFGISLGRSPAALLLPTAGISFAAAGLGLVVAALSQAHDSVMPLGTMISMAMSAVGGCWWPLGFEPSWMRAVAGALPTTWAMQAFNDLMIRRAPPSAALRPFAMTVGLGAVYLLLGLVANARRRG
jgi:ABC-type multidrug transport system permease subunit